jgi:hypothetical protein
VATGAAADSGKLKPEAVRLRLGFVSTVHALLLTAITFYWMNVSWELGDEILVARVNEILKELIFEQKDSVTRQVQSDLLLVNTSYDKMLIAFEDDYAMGTRAVTDRKKLTSFLNMLAAAQPRLVVVDLLFDYPSPDDSLLEVQLQRMPNVVLATRQTPDGRWVNPFDSVASAPAFYSTFSGTFLKYPVAASDSIKFLPARMWEMMHERHISTTAGFARTGGEWWLNAPIIDISFRRTQVLNNELLMWNLGDMFNYSDAFPIQKMQAVARNKIVIVGDFFEYDEHQTLLGREPGPLLLANAYLTLERGLARLRWGDFLLVFLLYLATTIYILRLKRLQHQMGNWRVFKWKIGKFIVKYLTYLFLFSLYTVLLYFFTGKHFQLLLFAFYFNVIDFLASKYEPHVARWLGLHANAAESTTVDSTEQADKQMDEPTQP